MKEFVKWIMKLEQENPMNKLRKGSVNSPMMVFFPLLPQSNEMGFFVNNKIPLKFICVPDLIYDNAKKQFAMYLSNDMQLIKLSQVQAGFKGSVFFFKYIGFDSMMMFIEYMRNLGINSFIGIGGIFGEQIDSIYNKIKENLDNIYTVYDMLDSEKSKKIYLQVLTARMTGDFSKVDFSNTNQYHLPGYSVEENDVVIDGGVYNGQTDEEFMAVMKGKGKIYGFEMSAANYDKYLKAYDGRYKEQIIFENYGIGEVAEEITYVDNEAGTSISEYESNENVIGRIIDLDTYMMNKGIEKVDFIKMDIEGAEMAALRGAARTISLQKPKMAICLYHKTSDYWEIPLYIKSLCPQAKMEIRHHFSPISSNDKVEIELVKQYSHSKRLKTIFETVVYVK